MGWCSGTEIMDAAVKAGESMAREAFKIMLDEHPCCGVPEDWTENPEVAARLDDILRPFVRSVARKLHDGDWDCVEEAEAFNRFPQEMLDQDDKEHAEWLRDQLADALYNDNEDRIGDLTDRLTAHTDKMKAGTS